MNGKLYIFGIGGTGSRVIKSLVMLAASGAKIDTKAIVPIIIDPDFANADLTRTIEQINTYSAIRKELAFNDVTKNKFFEVPIEEVVDNYRLTIKDTKEKKFREFIDFDTMSKSNRAFASMLFSEKNLESNMEVGFKGNPNVGSVVLNQFADSDDFINFAAAFKPGDRIFIISSIFGGTGASGFPLLLKNLRSLDADLDNRDAIRNAPIGAITVLPYFDIKPEGESDINSASFIGKAKAALQYYDKNVSGDESSINVLYYIGDDKPRTTKYENNEGGNDQRNNAHIIELAAAMSIIDFAAIQDDDQVLMCKENNNGKVFAPKADFREFGLEEDAAEVLFTNLTQTTREQLCTPMTQFVLFAKYINEHLKHSITCDWAKDNKIDDAFLKSAFIANIQKLTKAHLEWLAEMADNDRAFKPFKLTVSGKELYSIVDGVKPASINAVWAWGKNGYDLFNHVLDKKYSALSKNLSLPQKFAELFYITTSLLVEEKYKF